MFLALAGDFHFHVTFLVSKRLCKPSYTDHTDTCPVERHVLKLGENEYWRDRVVVDLWVVCDIQVREGTLQWR